MGYIFCWCRALCKVTAPHTSVFGSPQVAQISEKMSTLAATVTKWRLTGGVRGPRRPHPRVLTERAFWLPSTQERAESGDTSEGRAGRRQEGRGRWRWCCRWWRRRGSGDEHFEAIGGDVRSAQAQGWCLNMLPTNMAPVSLSSSLFSVTMYNPASSPRLLTMSFHIMLPHTRSCTQQAVTQLLCLRVRPFFFFFFFFSLFLSCH